MTDDDAYVPGSLGTHDCPGCGQPIAKNEKRCVPCTVDLTGEPASLKVVVDSLAAARAALSNPRGTNDGGAK